MKKVKFYYKVEQIEINGDFQVAAKNLVKDLRILLLEK